MGKKIWIATGLVAAVGLTAAVAHAQRGHHGSWGEYGGYRGGGYHDEDRGWHGRGHGRGYGRGPEGGQQHGWGRELTKEDFDAMTRSKFAKWDTNSDGVVDKAEVEAHFKDRSEHRSKRWGRHGRHGDHIDRRMRRFDTDRDGKITKAEVEAAVTKRFQRIDLDGDGRITDEDLPPMMRGMNILSGDASHHMGRHHGRHHGHRMLRHIMGADKDKDGAISLQEAQDRAAERFARFDRNKDGVIDTADREALRAEMLDYRVRRFFHRFGGGDGKLTLQQYQQHRNERFAGRDADADGVMERGERRGGWGRGEGRRERYDDRDDRGGPRGDYDGERNNGADREDDGNSERRDPQ